MKNLLIKWDNPTDISDIQSIRIYRVNVTYYPTDSNGEIYVSCKVPYYNGDLIFEKENIMSGAEEQYSDPNVGPGIWMYAAYAKTEWGHSPCASALMTIEGDVEPEPDEATLEELGADTTWELLGLTAPSSDSLIGSGSGTGPPTVDEGDTTDISNVGTCSDPLRGALVARFYYDKPPSSPCSSVAMSSGPFQNFNLDEWYHLAVVRAGQTAALYINGTPTAVISEMGAGNITGKGTAWGISQIGALSQSTHKNDWAWNGLIDQPTTWIRALTPNDIKQVYANGDGIKYIDMNHGLQNGLTHIIECQGSVEYTGPSSTGDITNINYATGYHHSFVSSDKIQNQALGSGQEVYINVRRSHTYTTAMSDFSAMPYNGPIQLTVNDGKVSDWSFSPCRDEILRDATDHSMEDAVKATLLPRAAIVMPGNPWPNFGDEWHPIEWTTSVWLKKYGEARSFGVALKIAKRLGFTATHSAGGALLADYKSWSDSRMANFLVNDRGNMDPAYPLWNL